MNIVQLTAILESYGLKIDGMREGAGKFRDFYIGSGAIPQVLRNCQKDLRNGNIKSTIRWVDNPQHPEYRQPYLFVESFWVES